jgi:phage shock protein C
MEKKLHRIPGESVIGGVAAGMADYFNIDKSLVRVIWVASLLLPLPPTFGWTILIYIILWAVLPEGGTSSQSFHSSGPRTPKPGGPSNTSSTIKILGIALILFGAVMLVDEFPIWYAFKEYFWPVCLIILGAYLLLNQRDKTIVDFQQEPIITPPPAAPKPEATIDPLVPDPNAPKNAPDKPDENEDGDIIKVN